MVSQTAEYALRAIVFLAMNAKEAFTTMQISEGTKVSAPYLSKVLQSLVKASLIGSQRGLGGGFFLLRDPGKISILDVITAVDPIQRIEACPLGLSSHHSLCALHQRLDDANAIIKDTFARTSIAEVVKEKRSSIPLCDSGCGNGRRR